MMSKRKSVEQGEFANLVNKKQRPDQISSPVQLNLFEDQLPKSRDNCLLHKFSVENWSVSGVTHFAFLTHGEGILAFIREDGQIEFWNAKNWSCFKIIPGRTNFTPSGLCWITSNPPRLFASSLNGELIEWDLQLDTIKTTEQVQGGGIWSIEASSILDDSTCVLAAACEDGVVRLYRLEENQLILYGQLQSESPRALCLGWSRTDKELLVGYSDGTTRLWDLTYTNHDSKVNIGRESVRVTLLSNATNKVEVHTTVVLCMDEFCEFVCGDSLGRVTIWDKRYGTQLSSFQKHQGVITTLKTYYQDSVFYLISSGVDGSVIFYKRSEDHWEYVHVRRPHVHDILCMGVFVHGSRHSILTGCRDSTVKVLSCQLEDNLVQMFLKRKCNTIDFTPQRPCFQLAPSKRLLMVIYKSKIELWKIPSDPSEVDLENRSDGELVSTKDEPHLLTKMKISNEDHLTCGDLSSHGDYLAFSTRSHFKIMKLGLHENHLTFQKVKLNKKLHGVCLLLFSSDSKWLFIVDWHNNLVVMDLESKRQCWKMSLPNDSPSSVLEAKIPFRCHPQKLESSHDGHYLCIQFHSSIVVYSIPEFFHEHGLTKLVVFKSNSPISAMAILSDNGIFAATHDGTLRRYGIHDLSCTERSHRQFQGKQIHSIISTPKERKSVILFSGWTLMHLGLDSSISSFGGSGVGQNPRVMNINQNHRLLYGQFLSSNSILLVQIDWTKVLKKMSPPVYRHRYGT
eukprot:g3764.t1